MPRTPPRKTLWRAAQNFDRFVDRGTGSFRAWVITIAKNEVIDEVRRRTRDRHVPFPEAREWIDPDPSPEEQTVRMSERERFHALIQKLPRDQRAVMEYRAAGLTTAEIAELMKTSQANVRKLQERAIDAIRARLNAEEDGDGR